METLLDKQAVLEAAHSCYALALAEEFEERGGRFEPRTELHEWADKLPDEKQLPIIYYYLGRIAQAWGYEIGLVFHHAGIVGAAEQERALCHLLLGCQGHGVSLADDYREALALAEDKLSRTFKPAPIYFDDMAWRDLAIDTLGVQ